MGDRGGSSDHGDSFKIFGALTFSQGLRTMPQMRKCKCGNIALPYHQHCSECEYTDESQLLKNWLNMEKELREKGLIGHRKPVLRPFESDPDVPGIDVVRDR